MLQESEEQSYKYWRHYLGTPCDVVRSTASGQSIQVRRDAQLFRNNIKEGCTHDGVPVGSVAVVLCGHEIRYNVDTKTVACNTCQRYHPLSKLSAFLVSLARGAEAQDGFFCSFFGVSSFGNPQNPQHLQDGNHETWRDQLVEQIPAEDLAQRTHDLLSITQV